MMDDVRVQIEGKPYLLTLGEFGWTVRPLSSPTDRFYRNYLVTVAEDGRPLRCSCPDCYHRGHWCKHLVAIENLWKAANPEEYGKLVEEAARAGIDLTAGEHPRPAPEE